MKKNEVAPVVSEVSAPVAEVIPAKKAFSLPYKVTCSKCGAVKAVRQEVLLKRLVNVPGANLEERFSNHIATYKCQDCKRVERLAELEKSLPAPVEAPASAE